jgi:FKBP-type peptidyl-prolyl cis-trans isomerase
MVLMRRKDRRRENAEDNLTVASDSTIVANKGVRSLRQAATGRFAADMRVSVGGYGRADKTWGVDHPWHRTRQDLFSTICEKDRMEEGDLVKQEEKKNGQGLSRAALKRMKAKMKKGILPKNDTIHQEETKIHDEDASFKKKAKKNVENNPKSKKLPLFDDSADEKVEEKATKIVIHKLKSNKNKKKDLKRNTQTESKEDDDEQVIEQTVDHEENENSDDVGDIIPTFEAKETKENGTKKEKKSTSGADILAMKQLIQKRDELAKEYESSFGNEITTSTGLVILDHRIGQGKLPEPGQMMTVKYKGSLGKEGLVFGKGMLTINFGTGSLITGWEEGMSTMRPGGKRALTIPPELAYGSSGKGEKIPPNSTLHFEVELVRIGKRKRETIGKDDIPLPSSFNRKKMMQNADKKNKTYNKKGRKNRHQQKKDQEEE